MNWIEVIGIILGLVGSAFGGIGLWIRYTYNDQKQALEEIHKKHIETLEGVHKLKIDRLMYTQEQELKVMRQDVENIKQLKDRESFGIDHKLKHCQKKMQSLIYNVVVVNKLRERFDTDKEPLSFYEYNTMVTRTSNSDLADAYQNIMNFDSLYFE